MPDFSARITAGVTLQAWTDPPDGARPSRINPLANRGHLRTVGDVGVQVQVSATINGALAPLDALLGGRLFVGMMGEWPVTAPIITTPVGQSSVQRFTPAAAGHYTFVMRRDGGGAMIFHIDVQ